MTSNACCVWDFRCNIDLIKLDHLKSFLNNYCKEWCFQAEKGEETGYEHYQGRMSLKIKKRKNELVDHLKGLKDNLHTITIRPTSNENKNNFFYVLKEETRIAGPWSSKDEPEEPQYIPRQYRGKLETLKPFQNKIIELSMIFNDRHINLIYCPNGNKGKSTIAHLMRLHYKALVLPPLNDADRILYTACNMAMAKKVRESIPIFVDLPRAMNQDRLFGLYSAIESIKQGFLYDTRNHSKTWDMDSPSVFVFTNTLPDLGALMSKDRWQVWTIDENDELVRFKAEAKPPGTPIESEPSAQPAQFIYRHFHCDKKQLKVKDIVDTDEADDCNFESDSE